MGEKRPGEAKFDAYTSPGRLSSATARHCTHNLRERLDTRPDKIEPDPFNHKVCGHDGPHHRDDQYHDNWRLP